MKTHSPRKQKKSGGWDADVDAAARAEIVRAFHALISTGCYPVTAAARYLGISPSVMSGKNSLPFKFDAGGMAALRLTRRPSPYTHVAKLTQALKDRQVIVHQGRIIGGLQ